jgi:hypothetical protein
VRHLLTFAAALMLLSVSVKPAAAQSFAPSKQVAAAVPSMVPGTPARDSRFQPQYLGNPFAREAEHSVSQRPKALVGLYASLGVVQILDLVSTKSALKNGAVELNGSMRGSTGKQLGMKAAMTVGTIALTERLWKKNKVAAIVTAAAANSALAMISANNFRNAHR